MPDPVIRGPKLPLAWSTEKATGYVVEKTDENKKTDQILLEDEDGQFCTEITKIRQIADYNIEVTPLSTISESALPETGDIFTWGTKTMSILTISVQRVKGQVMKWIMTGNKAPGIPLD